MTTIDDLVEKLRTLRSENKHCGYLEPKTSHYHNDLVFSLFSSDDHFCAEYIPRLPLEISELNIPIIGTISYGSRSRCIDEYKFLDEKNNIPLEKKKIMYNWYIRNKKPVPEFLKNNYLLESNCL